jgi:nitroreductase
LKRSVSYYQPVNKLYGMINEILQNRWSPYSFSSEPVGEEELNSLFEAAGLAPSSNNEQPWLFIHATRENEELFLTFLGFLAESNAVWAKNAWALAISFARLSSSYNGKPNRYALHDTGMAVSNLLAQATSMGIFVHQMAGYSTEKVSNFFNLREDVVPVAVMAIGYLGNGKNISPELYERDEKRRGRKPVSEYSFRNALPERYIKT